MSAADGATDDLARADQKLADKGHAVDAAELRTYEVVVVGGGTGGIAAAIQAARLKSRVALLEETDVIGGQMVAAAVSNIDGAFERTLSGGTGIYREFRDQVSSHYADSTRFPPSGKSIHTCYYNPTDSVCFEPAVGRKILEEMVAKAGVDLFLKARVVAASKSGNVVTGLTLEDGQLFDAKVVIDATEYGDVIPLTGAEYRAGNSLSGAIDPSACVQDITHVAVVKKYPGGLPADLKIVAPPPQCDGYKAKFAAVVAKDGTNSWTGWNDTPYPISWAVHNAYRGLPDSDNPQSYDSLEFDKITRTNLNRANDYPGSLGGNVTVSYLEQPLVRQQVNCEAKLLTLCLISYVQTELEEPLWSVANDQGYDTEYHQAHLCDDIPIALKPLEQHMPPVPYVRESRRIVAVKTLTAKEIIRTGNPARAVKNFPTAVAVGDYATDLHRCSGNSDLETDLAETGAHGSGVGVFQVPFETLIPQKVDGLLAAEKNIGVSRLANGATRLQPITMATGQAAGAIAALAIQAKVQPRHVRPIDVQVELVNAGVNISLYDFSDVPRSSALWPSVQLVSARQIMIGNGVQFDPDGGVNRAMAAVVVAKLFELDTSNPPATPTFSDVPTTHWAYAHIEAIFKAQLTGGCSAGPPVEFCPTAPATRGQLAVFLIKGLGLDPNQAPTAPIFADVPATHQFFKHIQLAAANGLFTGCSTSPMSFCPDAQAIRSETAVAAARTLIFK